MSELGSSLNVKGYNGDIAILETDKDLIVTFEKKAVLNQAKSREAGTPIYDEVDYCQIMRPGEPHSKWDQPVRPIDKARFADAWKRYQEGKSQEVSGTPLSILFPDNPAIVATFKAVQITTIQQLAGLSDNAIQNVQFGHDFRKKAQDYINATKKSGEELAAMTQKHEAEMAEQRAKTSQLERQLAELIATANRPKRKYTRRKGVELSEGA